MGEKKEQERKHYAGRWICQKPANKCNGIFSVYGEPRPCPLKERCLQSEDFRGQLEYVWPRNRFGKLIIQSEPDWDRKHLKRRGEARNVFCRKEENAYQREYYRRPGMAERARARVKASRPPLRDLIDGYVPSGVKVEMPPCGGDCRNGPYPECPDTCRYEDWEGPRAKHRRQMKEINERSQERRKQRMKDDPEYREKERAKSREASRRYRAKVKAIMEQQQKGGGSTYHGK